MLNRDAGNVSRIDINDGASIGGGDYEMWCAQGDANKNISDSPFIGVPDNQDAPEIGKIRFGSDIGIYFPRHILRPLLSQYLTNDAPGADVRPATVFVTGVFLRGPNRRRPLLPQASGRISGYGRCTFVDRRLATAVRNKHD